MKSEFVRTWTGYKHYAWGHDELTPLSDSYYDWYGASLYLTPVDALDTMIFMGLTSEADEDRALIDQNLNFHQDFYVDIFEITIRDLGGLLSAYQLTGDKTLLHLADDLGTRLLPAFNSPTGMPYLYVNLQTGAVEQPATNPAQVGTYLIEFGVLSKLTGKSVYYDTAKRAAIALFNRRSAIGLVGNGINVETGAWTDPTSTIGGGTDSYYEYLLKGWKLFADPDLLRMWQASIMAINTYLADYTSNGLWYGQADMNTGRRVSTDFGALDAFFPGVLTLSGDLTRARELEDSAFLMWNVAGIEPDELDYSSMTIVAPRYGLNPEIAESAYYLYFFTGDPHFQDIGRTVLSSLMARCRTPAGYAELSSVNTGQQLDRMQSYFLAETLKYLYLLFAPPQTLDLNSIVFNTEAHPQQKALMLPTP